MNKKYGIVVVGCGQMGEAHLNEIYYRENIEIRGVVDFDSEKAKTFMKKYGASSWRLDYREYLKDPYTDIFIISTYPATHLEILRNCLKHNKNVLCEKPIATNIEDVYAFVNLVKESRAKVLIGHILRHNKTYNKVAKMIHEGLIGSPIVMRIVQNHHTKNWQRYKKLINDTPPIIDCGVHYFDIMQWFTRSRITGITGIGTTTELDISSDKYNYGMVSLRYEDGSVGYYEAGWGNTIASENIKEFIGPKGRIKIIYQRDRTAHKEEGDLIELYNQSQNKYKMINVQSNRKPTWEQMQQLIQMIESGAKAVPSIDEVLYAHEIAFAADEAIKTGKSVTPHLDYKKAVV